MLFSKSLCLCQLFHRRSVAVLLLFRCHPKSRCNCFHGCCRSIAATSRVAKAPPPRLCRRGATASSRAATFLPPLCQGSAAPPSLRHHAPQLSYRRFAKVLLPLHRCVIMRRNFLTAALLRFCCPSIAAISRAATFLPPLCQGSAASPSLRHHAPPLLHRHGAVAAPPLQHHAPPLFHQHGAAAARHRFITRSHFLIAASPPFCYPSVAASSRAATFLPPLLHGCAAPTSMRHHAPPMLHRHGSAAAAQLLRRAPPTVLPPIRHCGAVAPRLTHHAPHCSTTTALQQVNNIIFSHH
jgi:hypothetical protein